jgi:hypothetical protein
MIKKGEKNQIDSFSPIQLKLIIPATHYFPLSLHICHAFSPQETTPEVRQYFSFYFEISSYTGTLSNAEPEKSEHISWIDWQKEEKIQFREILEKIEQWETYSELDQRD